MDSHARSLLERLNISASPKVPKLTTPEKGTTPVPAKMESDKPDTQNTPGSSPPRRPIYAAVAERDATTSLKDLLVSARQRSRETSTDTETRHVQSQPEDDESKVETSHLESKPTSAPIKSSPRQAVHTSDGETSVNPEEIPTTPSGSNKSSVASNGPEALPDTHKEQNDTPPGLYILNDAPSVVALPSIKTRIPKLQITMDAGGHACIGDGVEQISNISRTFNASDRDVISANTKYIVYALKGMLHTTFLTD
jgi:hypothetical protein